MVKLRGHHLLCLLNWQGVGYDDSFVDNFDRIICRLLRDEAATLVNGADEICSACPHRSADNCSRSPSARLLDQRVFRVLEISPGDSYDLSTLVKMVTASLRPSDLRRICFGCSWLEKGWCATGAWSDRRVLLTMKGP